MTKEKLPEKIEKKLKEGWVRSWMMIEVMAITEEAAKHALKEHVKKMEHEPKAIVFNTLFKDIKIIENFNQNIKKAYSNIVEVELITKNLEELVFIAMRYAPSAMEIISPKKLSIDIGEAQSILNSMSEMIHKFAAAGLGGVIINS